LKELASEMLDLNHRESRNRPWRKIGDEICSYLGVAGGQKTRSCILQDDREGERTGGSAREGRMRHVPLSLSLCLPSFLASPERRRSRRSGSGSSQSASLIRTTLGRHRKAGPAGPSANSLSTWPHLPHPLVAFLFPTLRTPPTLVIASEIPALHHVLRSTRGGGEARASAFQQAVSQPGLTDLSSLSSTESF
jgi:hypothetical protein